MALTVCAWVWGDKYGADHVERLVAGVRRHLSQPHRFILVTEWRFNIEGVECVPIPDLGLTKIKGCFARLRMFDPAWQAAHGIVDRLACVDLDTVITGPLDPLFDRPEPFVILQGGNYSNPCPFGGALMMLRPGAHPEVWSDFSIEKAAKARFHEFPDDQGWLWHKVPDAPGWKVGPEHGVYVFRKPQWPVSDALPAGARLVTFNGGRDPKKFQHLKWIQKHWTL